MAAADSMAKRLLQAIAILAVIIAAALLIAQDQETLRFRSQLAAGDPRFPEYIAALTNTPLTHGDRYDVLVNGDEIFPAMLDAIRAAKRRISFETYIYSRGEIPDRFTHELAAAAGRGVEVNIVLDAMGAQDISAENLNALRDAGCQIGSFNPTRWYSIEEINYRTHRKMLVVDGEVAFTGGVGVADHWAGNAQDPEHWRDTQVKVVGPAVRYLEAAFYENWAESRGEVKPALDAERPVAAGDTRSVVALSSPVGGSSTMKRLYLLSIAGATRTLDISSPYFIADESARWSLEQARRRGVRVRVLVEGEVTDAKAVKYASRADYDALMQIGIEIHEYQPTMMHAKALVVDGIWSIVGSANFDNRSLELNDELNVGVGDRGLAAKLTDDFETDLSRARRLTLEAWRQRPFQDKAREKLWGLFAEVF